MYVKHLTLENFRNYDKLSIDFDEKINLILGNNAQGKTNLLEAIYVTSCGKSFRTAKDNEMIGFDKEFCRIEMEASKEDEDIKVEVAIAKNSKAAKIDGVPVKKSSDLLKNVFIVIFSPEDMKIVKEEPEKRRRFLNRELCQIKSSYNIYLSKYKKALYQRNTLLKDPSVDRNLLLSWNDELVKYGVPLIKERNYFIERMAKVSKAIHEDITGNKESLNVKYEPNVRFEEDQREQRNIFYDALAESLDADLKAHHTTRGPHKDDISLSIDDVDIRHFGSQGQQRTAALSLKLAEISMIKEGTGESPILLLDDVMSELDGERQAYMINAFKDVQIFISTTELYEDVKDAFKGGKVFKINSGSAAE